MPRNVRSLPGTNGTTLAARRNQKETYHRGLKMFARMLSALNTFAPTKRLNAL